MELPRPPLKQNLAAAYSCARHAPAKARPKLFGNNSITEFKSSPTGEGGLSSNLRTTKINKREETLRFRSASQSDGPFAGIQRQVDGRLHFFSPSACLTTQIRTKVFTSRTTGSDGSTAWHTPKKNSAPSAVRRPRDDIVPQCAKLIWTFQPTTGRQLNRPESKHSR